MCPGQAEAPIWGELINRLLCVGVDLFASIHSRLLFEYCKLSVFMIYGGYSVLGQAYNGALNCPFLAVQDSSIGDLVTHSVSQTPFDFRALQSCGRQCDF